MEEGNGSGPNLGDVFSADPEVGADLASVDWSATALGPPDRWPLSLQTAVRILLRSRFSMWMAWGPDLTFICNDAYRRDTLGGKYPWALGRPAREVWAEIWADIEPRIGSVLTTGVATWDQGLLLILERSGFPEETYHTFSYSALSDDAGQIVGMLCVVSEDTTRVIGERRMTTLRDLGSDPTLSASERQTLESAVSRLGRNRHDLPFALVYLVDDDGVMELAAQTEPLRPGTRWPHEEALAGRTTVVDFDSSHEPGVAGGPWPAPPTQAMVTPLAQPGIAPYGFLVVGLNPYRPLDDDYRGFVLLIAAHLAAEIGSARTYSGQQRRAAELVALDRAKTTFFSNVSHEFRTPLTLMVGPVSDLLRSDDGSIDDATRHQLEVVHRNGLRMTKLVNTLLDFSRIEADRMEAHFVGVDVAAVTADLASGFRSAVERAGLDFVVDCRPVDEPLHLDRDMWEKIILNLLSNAVKFTAEGSIEVRVRSAETAAVVTVADTGIGVAADELPRLFERFHRVPTAWARSFEGSGIGLALVSELVGMHGGTIDVESEVGRGTRFTIRIPFGTAHLPQESLAEADEQTNPPSEIGANAYLSEALRWLPGGAPAPGPAHPAAPISASGTVAVSARVLVVDDNADMRDYVTRLLADAGYETDEATDGQHALEIVDRRTPDLVISDVMMPRMDGLELVAALRGDSRTKAMPVVLLSARADQTASVDGLRAGADDYLVKPFAASELLARVDANLSLARLRGHHERWRAALIDSLQEAFFVCDDEGAVVEMNAAFTDVLGFGPDGLPYRVDHPWWPDAASDPDARQVIADAFAGSSPQGRAGFTVPIVHRDGHRLWVTFTIAHATDPDTGRRVTVGTVRDVTAEHYRVRRESAIADLDHVLAQTDLVDGAVASAAVVLRDIWGASRVVAATYPSGGAAADPSRVVTTDADTQVTWADLAADVRSSIDTTNAGNVLLTPVAEGPGSATIALPHPEGTLVVWIGLVENRPFTEPDRTLLIVLAGHLSQGLHRVYRSDQQRQTALALQQAILGPSTLPDGFAAKYHPASQPLQVGGDWYDVIEFDDGKIGVIVGDCVGHGLHAASVMGQLRSASRALLVERSSPAAALSGLDRFAAHLPGARCTTVLCGVLDTATGEFVYSSAGHPPAIVLAHDGSARTLTDGRSIPIGVRPGHPRPEAVAVLPPRATLLAYTDGLVERRGESLDDSIARATGFLRAVLNMEDLAAMANHVVAALSPTGGYPDDVAILLYRHPAPLALTFAADAEQLGPTRTALRTWLRSTEMGATQINNLLVAAGEAVSNAIEHGRRGLAAGGITLTAYAAGENLHLRVVDTGVWKSAGSEPDPTRGRGIGLMHALTEHAVIRSDHLGTTVDLHARIIL